MSICTFMKLINKILKLIQLKIWCRLLKEHEHEEQQKLLVLISTPTNSSKVLTNLNAFLVQNIVCISLLCYSRSDLLIALCFVLNCTNNDDGVYHNNRLIVEGFIPTNFQFTLCVHVIYRASHGNHRHYKSKGF